MFDGADRPELPHMVFASLTSYSSFSALFGVESLETFWRDAEKCGDDRLDHPMKVQGWRKKTIPLFVHGDGVEYQTRDSLMVWSWGGS